MKKRIAFVINTLSNGGAERVVSNLSLALADSYEVDIVVNDDKNIAYPYEGTLISLGMQPVRNRMAFAYQAAVLCKRIRLLKRLKKEKRYRAVISFSEFSNAANVLSGNRCGKTILSFRNSVERSAKNSLKYRVSVLPVIHLLYPRADKLVACSKEMTGYFLRHTAMRPEKITTVYNSVDAEKIRSLCLAPLTEEQQNQVNHPHLLVTAGRLTRQKGQWHLIRALREVKAQGFDFRLLILGEGELRPMLEKLVRDAGLAQNVIFCGFVKNPYPLLQKAELALFPSLYEGFSNVLVECLACQTPVISTDHATGAREILAPDTDYAAKTRTKADYARYGVLVPVCDGKYRTAEEPLTREEAILAQTVAELLQNEALRTQYKQRAPERVAALRPEVIAREWIKIIEET